jgi:CheY-like chemotaxis protein
MNLKPDDGLSFMHADKTVHLILVEDDEVDVLSIQRAFTKLKIKNPMRRVKDGIEALHLLRGEEGYEKLTSPFILLVDINMPRMSGLELIQEIRQDEDLRTAIIFVLTTSSHEEDKFAAYNLNVAGYILKDNAGNDFIRIVNLLDCYWRIIEFP